LIDSSFLPDCRPSAPHAAPQADTFSYGVALWELITKSEETQRGNWRPLRVPEECPAEVAALQRDCIQAR